MKNKYRSIIIAISVIALVAVIFAFVFNNIEKKEEPVRTIKSTDTFLTNILNKKKNSEIINKDNITNVTVNTFSDDNGLPTGEANAVVQGSDGFIWVGGYGGLLRYDGRNFVQTSGNSTGLTSYSIRSLFVDSRGTLWVGSNEQGVFYMKDGEFCQPEQEENSTNLSVRCFTEDDSGRMWFGTSNGLAFIENNCVVTFDFEDHGYSNSTIYTLSVDSNGNILAVDYSGSVISIDPSNMNLLHVYSPGELWDNNLYAYSAFVSKNGTVFVGTNDSVIIKIAEDFSSSETIDSGDLKGINSICENRNGEIWFCGDSGVGLIQNNEFSDLSYIDNSTHLGCIQADYEGNIWTTSSKTGLLYIQRGNISKLIDSPIPENKEAYCIYKFDNKTYVGSEIGLIILDENNNSIENNLTAELSGTQVHNIAESSDGKLYLATYYKGLYIYDPDTDEFSSMRLSAKRLRCIIQLNNGDMAVATDNGVDILSDEEIICSYTDFGIVNQILCLLELDDGTILCGSDGAGIFAISKGEIKEFGNTSNGLSGGIILRMAKDSVDSNLIWVSCGNDLFYGNSDGFTQSAQITEGDGSILDIFPSFDKIWLYRSSGVLEFNRSDLMDSLDESSALVFYGVQNGLPDTIVANSWSYFKDNNMIICTTDGIGFINCESLFINNTIPQAAICDITFSDGTNWDGSDNIVLSPDNKKLSVSMAALSFTGKGAKIEYQMEGIDPEPIIKDISSQNETEYTNLTPGSYTFVLRAINSDGIAGQPIRISIERMAKFTETVWFPVILIILASLIVGVTLALINYVRIKSLEAKQKMYKSLTEQSILTISGAIDAKDPYTKGHSLRVADFSVKIAKKMGLSEDDCERLYYIALLHDIGKIGIPDSILKKPDKLTDEEYEVIRQHPKIGSEILKDFTALDGVAEGAKYHHERYDGKGYNEKLAGEDIPLFARIIGIADSFDAMNSRRCYRPELSLDYILSELEKGRNSQFDSKIVDYAVEVINEENYQ